MQRKRRIFRCTVFLVLLVLLRAIVLDTFNVYSVSNSIQSFASCGTCWSVCNSKNNILGKPVGYNRGHQVCQLVEESSVSGASLVTGSADFYK